MLINNNRVLFFSCFLGDGEKSRFCGIWEVGLRNQEANFTNLEAMPHRCFLVAPSLPK